MHFNYQKQLSISEANNDERIHVRSVKLIEHFMWTLHCTDIVYALLSLFLFNIYLIVSFNYWTVSYLETENLNVSVYVRSDNDLLSETASVSTRSFSDVIS